VNCERSPALDLHPLPVDDLTGDDGSAAALCAELGRDTPSDAAWGDDPRELRRCRARSRSKSSWERWGFDACGGGLRRTRKGGTSALRDVGLHGDLWEGGRADPTWDHHGGRPHAEQPELVRPIPGASARGRFCHVEFCGPIFTRPGFPAPVREYYDVIPLTRAPHAAEGPHHDLDGFFPRKSSSPRSGGRTPLVERGPNGIVPSRVAACRRRCARL
jgi:hypothetical protein